MSYQFHTDFKICYCSQQICLVLQLVYISLWRITPSALKCSFRNRKGLAREGWDLFWEGIIGVPLWRKECSVIPLPSNASLLGKESRDLRKGTEGREEHVGSCAAMDLFSPTAAPKQPLIIRVFACRPTACICRPAVSA